MRILQIIDSLHPGGAERMAIQIANGLNGHVELSALCSTREEGFLRTELHDDVKYIHAQRSGKVGFMGLYRIYKFIKTYKITHLHAHGTSCYTAYILKLFYPRLKIVWHDHYGNAEQLKSRPTKVLMFIASKMAAIIVVNQQLHEWAKHLNLSTNLHFLPNFSVRTNEKKIVRKNIPGNVDRRVVCLANLRPQKNQLMLIDIWRSIAITHPDWNLLIVGVDFKDNYSRKIKDRIKEYHLEKTVHESYGLRKMAESNEKYCAFFYSNLFRN